MQIVTAVSLLNQILEVIIVQFTIQQLKACAVPAQIYAKA